MCNRFLIFLCCLLLGFGIGTATISNYWRDKYEHEKEYIERIAETIGVRDTAVILEILEEEYLK